jgi:LEA14-like dessication related protein
VIRPARAAALACLALATGCPQLLELVDKPTVTLKSVDVTEVGLDHLTASFVLHVDNPNPIGAPVARLAYQLTIDGHPLVAGRADQNVSIPGRGGADVTLPVTVRFAELGESVESLATRESIPYDAHLTVGFDVPGGSFDVPLDKSGTFSLARSPEGILSNVNLPRW